MEQCLMLNDQVRKFKIKFCNNRNDCVVVIVIQTESNISFRRKQ